MMKMSKAIRTASLGLATIGLAAGAAVPAQAGQKISNSMARCSGAKPAVKVRISGIKGGGGTLRVQSYRGTKGSWLQKGAWLNRIEVPARAGTVTVCMPVPSAGTYAIAVRHDVNRNGKTDIRTDGGGMSNNPSINVLNLGKPSYTQTRFSVGKGVKPITIRMRYM